MTSGMDVRMEGAGLPDRSPPGGTAPDPDSVPAHRCGPPDTWPPAWRSFRGPLVRRAVFVLAVEVLTVTGLVLVGDLVHQWWALLPPLALLPGPLTRPHRARARIERAAAAGRLWLDPDGTVWMRGQPPFRHRPRSVARVRPDGRVVYLR